MLQKLLPRSLAHPDASVAPATRIEVCPPSLGRSPALLRVLAWLAGPWVDTSTDRGSRSASSRLETVREAFVAQLGDLHGRDADALRLQIDGAASLRELWHQRASLFSLVACQRSQHEAEIRVGQLNCHFPTRSPRSGLAPFDRLAELDARRQ